jgi:ribosomal protein L7/L12
MTKTLGDLLREKMNEHDDTACGGCVNCAHTKENKPVKIMYKTTVVSDISSVGKGIDYSYGGLCAVDHEVLYDGKLTVVMVDQQPHNKIRLIKAFRDLSKAVKQDRGLKESKEYIEALCGEWDDQPDVKRTMLNVGYFPMKLTQDEFNEIQAEWMKHGLTLAII